MQTRLWPVLLLMCGYCTSLGGSEYILVSTAEPDGHYRPLLVKLFRLTSSGKIVEVLEVSPSGDALPLSIYPLKYRELRKLMILWTVGRNDRTGQIALIDIDAPFDIRRIDLPFGIDVPWKVNLIVSWPPIG